MINSIKTKAGENYLTEAEEKTLFSYLKRLKEKQAERDFALLKVLRIMALRRAEAVALNVGDVEGKTLLVIDERLAAKGAMGTLQIPVEMQDVLRRYLRLKRNWGEDVSADAPLFVARKGGRLARRSVNDLVARWCKEAGLTLFTPHAFRHTKAQRIMADRKHLTPEEWDIKLNLVNKWLRHKTYAATLIYTAPTKESMAKVAAI